MNTRKAAPAIAVLSLVVLLSGCAAAASQGGQVRDDLSPAGNSAIGLARGHVIVRDNLSPLANGPQQESIAQAAQSDAQRAWSAEARREFHASRSASTSTSASTVTTPFSAAAMRELKSDAPMPVTDDLSPLNSGDPTSAPQPDTVDDDLSPLRESR